MSRSRCTYIWSSRLLCLFVLWMGWASAHADSFAYTDDDTGITHLTDRPNSERYERVAREPQLVPELGQVLPSSSMPRTGRRERMLKYDEMVQVASSITGVNADLLHAVVMAESGYDPQAVSPKGALGMMQLMPETARRYGVTAWNDPADNLIGGARYLADLLQQFNQDLRLAMAAYNAGERAVIRHGYRVPPFQETQHYVRKVFEFYERYRSGDLRQVLNRPGEAQDASRYARKRKSKT